MTREDESIEELANRLGFDIEAAPANEFDQPFRLINRWTGKAMEFEDVASLTAELLSLDS